MTIFIFIFILLFMLFHNFNLLKNNIKSQYNYLDNFIGRPDAIEHLDELPKYP